MSYVHPPRYVFKVIAVHILALSESDMRAHLCGAVGYGGCLSGEDAPAPGFNLNRGLGIEADRVTGPEARPVTVVQSPAKADGPGFG